MDTTGEARPVGMQLRRVVQFDHLVLQSQILQVLYVRTDSPIRHLHQALLLHILLQLRKAVVIQEHEGRVVDLIPDDLHQAAKVSIRQESCGRDALRAISTTDLTPVNPSASHRHITCHSTQGTYTDAFHRRITCHSIQGTYTEAFHRRIISHRRITCHNAQGT